MERALVVFETVDGQRAVHAEVVRQEFALQKGLGGREHLDRNEGMLFVFPEPSYTSFWMKDVPFSLDMIFIMGTTVVNVVRNVPAMSLDPQKFDHAVDCVLEVNGGWCDRNDIDVGTLVSWSLS